MIQDISSQGSIIRNLLLETESDVLEFTKVWDNVITDISIKERENRHRILFSVDERAYVIYTHISGLDWKERIIVKPDKLVDFLVGTML